MAHVFVQHKVKDYRAWKAVFDSFLETRRAGGEKSYQIFHPDDEPNTLLILFQWDSLTNARKFMAAPELKETMGAAGVLEAPEVYFLEGYARAKL
ncbi:MAG TPA: antibiotic biosynthesis monooxygenase [Anaerolineae bacterium]|nr:antibiotic biosynthesis monooxygenase [Anaerolineae bacterium]MCB0223877.1 antibiotic biosynthesis monooxygenase [Anaerolineae bacterium]MCB9102476.1 antibiotic biosynthesis monooxygenase [Anaerolineales bacterium]MCB9104916.1 antibiotic biosynthesis monooxygenase [Anaerolineales bacterium]HRV92523.1 antibiotic biosynthesis monooxygenase [Anaerolineae bacterium]